MIADFEYYLARGDVRQTGVKDANKARSLLLTAEARMREAENMRNLPSKSNLLMKL